MRIGVVWCRMYRRKRNSLFPDHPVDDMAPESDDDLSAGGAAFGGQDDGPLHDLTSKQSFTHSTQSFVEFASTTFSATGK